MREVAPEAEVVRGNKGRGGARLAKAKPFQLQEHHCGVIVVGGQHVDVLRTDAGLPIQPFALLGPAAAQDGVVVGVGVVALHHGAQARVWQAEPARLAA
ncbi:hypothetical protein D3C72_1981840 [compost metagenome]